MYDVLLICLIMLFKSKNENKCENKSPTNTRWALRGYFKPESLGWNKNLFPSVCIKCILRATVIALVLKYDVKFWLISHINRINCLNLTAHVIVINSSIWKTLFLWRFMVCFQPCRWILTLFLFVLYPSLSQTSWNAKNGKSLFT